MNTYLSFCLSVFLQALSWLKVIVLQFQWYLVEDVSASVAGDVELDEL